MTLKLLAASAAFSLLSLAAAQAQDYGTPPYESGAYGYAGYDDGGCEGFTIAGAHAGVTVLGINVGGGARARVGGDCHREARVYAPAEQPGAYVNGGYYNQEEAYPQPAYVNQGYAPVAYSSPPAYGAPAYGYSTYTYSQPVYAAPTYAAPTYGYAQQPCGCQGYTGY